MWGWSGDAGLGLAQPMEPDPMRTWRPRDSALAHHEKCAIVFVDSHARKSNDVGVVDCAKNGSLLQQRPGSTQDLQVIIPSGKMLY